MIRWAQLSDLPRILEIYAVARAYMKASGNPNQWGSTNPPKETLERDIALNQLYVVESEGYIHGVFALIFGADPTYSYIEGVWPNERPYATIHRIAADGTGGVFAAAVEFAKKLIGTVRIDTHADNAAMHHLIQKHGFVRCGIIYLENGDPRVAYQWTN